MKTAILGTGIVGRTIAAKLVMLGHKVSMGTRDVDKTRNSDEPDPYGNISFKDWFRQNNTINLKTFADAASDAEILFNCTGGGVSLAALELAGENHLSGKTLIDIANPLDFSKGMPPSLSIVNTDSLGEQIQKRFPNLKVVKTLNTMNAYIMVDPTLLKGEHNVFVCGNDTGAITQTKDILKSFGWKNSQIIELGDITNARGTEMLLPIWIRLWQTFGTGEFNFLIQRN